MSPLGPIERFMIEDHQRIDALLARAEGPDGRLDLEAYGRFRDALLRHIAMEEKVLLPDARTRRGGEPLPLSASLHRDHGEIARLLVRSPVPAAVDALRELLGRHNALEEGSGGLYATCDALAGAAAASVVERLRAQPDVPLAPTHDGPPHAGS